MFKGIVRKTVPLMAFGVGIVVFPQDWKKNKFGEQKLLNINESVLQQIQNTTEYKTLNNDPSYTLHKKSEMFPDQHHNNYIGTGLLFGPDLFEIDPIVFLNEEKGLLTSFYHLGDQLISQDGQIHNGIVSTILDEGLCTCGFPLVPSKKGVTAKLSIDFKNQAPPGSTVVLRANVIEVKGRKAVIEGDLQTLPMNPGELPIVIAQSKCILVEPKWFKYFAWIM